MPIRMSEGELAKLGFELNPQDPSQAIPIVPGELPDPTWTVDQLMLFGARGMNESFDLQNQANCLSRKSTVTVFHAGHALFLAKVQVVHGEWNELLKRHGIPITNAWEAIKLYERAGTEAAVASLTWAEAKVKFSITKKKKTPRRQTMSKARHRVAVRKPPIDAEELVADAEELAVENDAEEIVDGVPFEPDGQFEQDDDDERGGDFDADGGDDSDEAEQAEELSPFEVMIKIVDRLEYVEEHLCESSFDPQPDGDMLDEIERALAILGRIRQIVAAVAHQ